MNYNFTEGSRRILQLARRAAMRRGDEYVGAEHVLLGALRDREIKALLERFELRPVQVRLELIRRLRNSTNRPGTSDLKPGRRGWRRGDPGGGELPYSSRAKKVLELAMAEAREAGDDYVGSEHLLLGMIREDSGLAAEVLEKLGLTLERVRAARAGGEFESGSRLRLTLDDASDLSIYEQIVRQITEAVATGALRPGERLPTVRHLADELDIAPGTVARAYSELERQGLVVTEGPRGTRVAERPKARSEDTERQETLVGLLRPVAVAAFHLGGTADELRTALEGAMRGIFDRAA